MELTRSVCITIVPDMTSLVTTGRLQNIIEYCVKVHKTRQVGLESNNSPTVQRMITINDIQNVCSDFFQV